MGHELPPTHHPHSRPPGGSLPPRRRLRWLVLDGLHRSRTDGQADTLAAAEVSELGDVLVDAKGFTVYSFGKDQGTTSSCYGACEEAWPPVLVKCAPSGGEGVDGGELGTTERKDGSEQVTYAGHPLYTFFEDEAPGEANGNGVEAFGGVWNALEESGEAASSGTAVSGGGY